MSLQTALPFELDFFSDKPIHIEIDPQPLTSDAGLLLIRQFDHRIGLTSALADAIHDPRDPTRIEHTFPGNPSAS